MSLIILIENSTIMFDEFKNMNGFDMTDLVMNEFKNMNGFDMTDLVMMHYLNNAMG